MNQYNDVPPRPDVIDEAVAAIEELRADFGLRVLLLALTRSGIGETIKPDPREIQRAMLVILRTIIEARDPQLEAEIMAIGAGVIDNEGSVRALAARRGLTPAAISKRVIAFCDEWGLPPSSCMKSIAARESYAERNQTRTA